MKKDTQINFRINSDILKILRGYCHRNEIPISTFFTIVVKDLLINKKLDPELEKEFAGAIARVKRKDLCNKLYIIKNMYRRVMDMALSNFLTTGSVNMKSINSVLETFIKEFESFSDKIQKDIGTDFRLTVKRLRSQEFLVGNSKNWKMLNYTASK